MKKALFTLAIFTIYSFICTVFHSPVYAHENGIEVNPSIIQLDLATDQPQTTLTYTNHTSQTVTLSFSTSDVTEYEDSYNISFLDQKSAQNFKYGLSSWVEFSNRSLVLEPGGKGSITIFIDKDTLSPGGHYGSILADVQTAPGQGNVSVNSILATLLFVRTHTGKEIEKGSISTFQEEQNFFDFPQNFLLRFTNSGDTYVTPYGYVSIYDMWGNLVGKGILNTGSLLVLPETLRRMEIPVQTFGGILWPGIYHARLTMHFGKTNQQRESTATFFSFGSLPVIPIAVVVLLLVNGYLFWRKRKTK